MDIKITDMDHLGRGIGKIDGKVCFVPKSITGDTLAASLYKKSKNYDIAKIDEIKGPAKNRVSEHCPYYYTCGGCNISSLSYQDQLRFKENKIKNIFKKYLDMDIDIKVIGSKKEYSYRNKITYHYDKFLGLVGQYGGVIKIDNCNLVSDKVNDLYRAICQEDLSKVKTITIREYDNGLGLIIDGNMDTKNIADRCIEICQNNKIIYQKELGYIMLNDLKFVVSSQAFFQINTANITTLYDEIVKIANFSKEDRVIDLYSGVGSIGIYISKYVKEVTGIEIIPEAVKDAMINAKTNNINNVNYVSGDVSKLIDNELNGDILIVDPPRIGIDSHSIDVINESGIAKIIYVSCDAMTLVRDLKKLSNYLLVDVRAVDMFPQTHHCESVCLLERR